MYAVQNVGRCILSCSADNSLSIGYLDGQSSKGHTVPECRPAAFSEKTAAGGRKRGDCVEAAASPAVTAAVGRETDSGIGAHSASVAPFRQHLPATNTVALVGAAPAPAPAASSQSSRITERQLRPNSSGVQEPASAADASIVANLLERPASELLSERPLSLPASLLLPEAAETRSTRSASEKEASENQFNELLERSHGRLPAPVSPPAPGSDRQATRSRQKCTLSSIKALFTRKGFFKRFGSPVSN